MVALELVEARQAERELAVMADHERIARDLHDHIVQELFALSMGLRGLACITDQAAVQAAQARRAAQRHTHPRHHRPRRHALDLDRALRIGAVSADGGYAPPDWSSAGWWRTDAHSSRSPRPAE